MGNFGIFVGIYRMIAKLIILFMIRLFVKKFEIVDLSFRQVNKTIRDNSLMHMKRVTTMKGILI